LWSVASSHLPGFEAAGIANVKVTGLQKGGIIDQFINQWKHAEGAEDQRKAVASVGDKIKAMRSKAVNPSGSGLGGRFKEIRAKIDTWVDWASKAGSLSQDVPIHI